MQAVRKAEAAASGLLDLLIYSWNRGGGLLTLEEALLADAQNRGPGRPAALAALADRCVDRGDEDGAAMLRAVRLVSADTSDLRIELQVALAAWAGSPVIKDLQVAPAGRHIVTARHWKEGHIYLGVRLGDGTVAVDSRRVGLWGCLATAGIGMA